MRAKIRTSIEVPVEVWDRLRRLAAIKAEQEGGRPSMGRIVADLVERDERRPRLVKGGSDAA
jgi:hypothetical protein